MVRFLEYIVGRTLDGRARELKEYSIGVEVFDRRADYDSRIDPIVRVEARRLRSKLQAYYNSEGRDSGLRIDLPKGTYIPTFGSGVSLQAPEAAPRSIAVLPFTDASDYIGDGITQELIHRLTKIKGLRVVAWGSAARVRGSHADMYEAAKQLGVSALLTGSLRIAGSRLRVLAQLVDTATGVYLWSETYDRTMADVLEIQEGIACAIVRSLEMQLTGAWPSKPNPQAYDLYLKGRFHWNFRTCDGFRRAVDEFKQALEIDPSFALAWAGLADTYVVMADYSCAAPADVTPLSMAAAQHALELDPSLGEAEATLGLIKSVHQWKWEEAQAHFRKAIDLNPGYATAFHWYACDHLALLGRFHEARQTVETACRLDPLSTIILESRGLVTLLERRYEEALAEYRKALDFDPGFHKLLAAIGRVSIQLGNLPGAIEALERAVAFCGQVPSMLGALAQAHGLAGNETAARAMLDQLRKLAESQPINYTTFAVAHLGLDEKDLALDWIGRGLERRESPVAGLGVHPVWDPLRGEPRFQAYLERIFGTHRPENHMYFGAVK